MSDTEKKPEEPTTATPATTNEKPETEKNEASTSPEAPVESTETPSTDDVEDAAESAEPQKTEEERVAEQEALARKQAEEEKLAAEEIATPDALRAGLTVRVHQKIKEGEKERIQVFQGIIIALRGKTPETKTMTVQKNSFGILVDKIFPLQSPLIEKIEVVKKAKVRRAKLYFLNKYTKRLKETLVKQ